MVLMHLVIAGASGFLGSHLTRQLRDHGHEVTTLTRGEPEKASQSPWRPDRGEVDHALVDRADVVVNLAGSPTLGNPHSKTWQRNLQESRVSTTRTLAEAIAASSTPPAFLAGNAMGWYGDHGDALVTEESDTRGDALLSKVSRAWQEAAIPAEGKTRICFLRTAPVLDGSAPPLKQQKLQFKLGLGGKLGDGHQYFPMISLRDWLSAVEFLVTSDVSGPVNLCAPETPTNAEFTRALADAVHRPAFLPAPAVVLKRAAGPLAPELLGSVRAAPQVLLDAGHEFADHDIRDVIATALA
jgi:uncharacterized protein (TIGR01777 family)